MIDNKHHSQHHMAGDVSMQSCCPAVAFNGSVCHLLNLTSNFRDFYLSLVHLTLFVDRVKRILLFSTISLTITSQESMSLVVAQHWIWNLKRPSPVAKQEPQWSDRNNKPTHKTCNPKFILSTRNARMGWSGDWGNGQSITSPIWLPSHGQAPISDTVNDTLIGLQTEI